MEALNKTGLIPLSERRKNLSIEFAKSCVKNKQTRDMFPLHLTKSDMETRHREEYQATKPKKARLENSAIPYMQRLLNDL